jgi:Protein of unknown function (DUF3592)
MLRLLFGLIFGVVFLAVGLAHAVMSAQALIDALGSNSWPKVNATVTSTDTEITTGKYRSITPKISYQYTVKQTTYNGSRIWLLEGGVTENIAQETINSYPVNTVTSVSYKPSMPEISVLRPGPTWFHLLWCVGSWLIAAVGGAVTCFSWTHRDKKLAHAYKRA